MIDAMSRQPSPSLPQICGAVPAQAFAPILLLTSLTEQPYSTSGIHFPNAQALTLQVKEENETVLDQIAVLSAYVNLFAPVTFVFRST